MGDGPPPEDSILYVKNLSFRSSTFDEQVEELMVFVRVSREEVLGYSQLYKDLERTLSVAWPGCQCRPFGSVVSGLAIKTSDADCYIKIPDIFDYAKSQITNMDPRYQTTPKYEPRDCAKLARNIFDSIPQRYITLNAVLNARVPFIQCYYKPLDVKCDVSFSSENGPINSGFIGFLLNMDRRTLLLAIILKYWSKVHNLTGLSLLPNYAFYLMIIFYLQTRNMLPPFHDFINDEQVVNLWNYGYNKEELSAAVRSLSSSNPVTLLDLVGGFFTYYEQFDFANLVICPYLGYPVERKMFEREKQTALPAEFRQYIENCIVMKNISFTLRTKSSIAVQDIFEHNRNCSSAVYIQVGAKFNAFIQEGAKIYVECQQKNDYSNFLYDILSFVPQHYIDKVFVVNRRDYTALALRNKRKKAIKKAKFALKVEARQQAKKAANMMAKRRKKSSKNRKMAAFQV